MTAGTGTAAGTGKTNMIMSMAAGTEKTITGMSMAAGTEKKDIDMNAAPGGSISVLLRRRSKGWRTRPS